MFIQETTNDIPRPATDLITAFSNAANNLTGPNQEPVQGVRFTLRYIRAHQGVTGNEEADMAAKLAAAGNSSPIDDLPPLLRDGPLQQSAGAPRKTYADELQAEAKRRWKASPRKAQFDPIDPNYPFDGFRKIQNKLTRAKASLLMQLRTGHIPLNSYLARFNRSDSPQCTTCWELRQTSTAETLRHYLFECPTYNWERADMDQALGRDSRDMKTLMSNEKHINILMAYIGKTERLRTNAGEL